MKKLISLINIVLFLFILSGCNETLGPGDLKPVIIPDTDYSYEDFKDSTIIDFNNVLDRHSTLYFVYFYGDNCSHCATIKNDILYYTSQQIACSSGVGTCDFINETLYPTYIVKSNSFTNENCEEIGLGSNKPTPQLMIIINNKVSNIIVGSISIPIFLNEVTKGTKDPYPIYSYDEFEDLYITEYDDVKTKSSGKYLVYYYDNFVSSVLIKDDVLTYTADVDKDYDIYLLKSSSLTDVQEQLLGISDGNTTTIPKLLIINNGEVESIIDDSDDIVTYLNDPLA